MDTTATDVSHLVLSAFTLLGTLLLITYKIVKKCSATFRTVKKSDCSIVSCCCDSRCHTKNKDTPEPPSDNSSD